MPKMIMRQDGGEIVYSSEDWLGGMDTTSTLSTRRKLINGLAFADQVDPLREPGYISVGPFTTDVTNITAITAYLRNGVVSGSSAYIISGGTLLHQLTSLTSGTVTNSGSWPHTMNNAAAWTVPVGDDIANYYTGTTLRTFFSLSYSEGGTPKWNVGIYNQVATTFDDDFMSTVPATPLGASYITDGAGFPHPLVVGDDDVLYIGDRNFVHAYDGQVGAAGTFTAAVLTLPVGWVITSFAKKKDRKLMISAYYSPSGSGASTFNLGSAKSWQWTYLDLDPDFAYDLHDNYVSETFNWNGTIACFTTGRKTDSEDGNYKLQALVGDEFEVLATYKTGGLPIRGGVDVVEQDIFWNAGGKLYSYCQVPYSDKWILNNIYGNGDTTSGMLKLFTQLFTIHFSDGASTGAGLRYTQTSQYHLSGQAWGAVAYPVWPALKRGRLKKVDIDFAAPVSGGRTFALNTGLDSSSIAISGDIQTVTNPKVEIKDYRNDGTPLGDFSALQCQLTWGDAGSGANRQNACPLIDKVTYHFEYTNIDQ